MPRTWSTPVSRRPARPARTRTRRRPRWSAASRCGPRGCPRRAGSRTGRRWSSPSTPATCSSSTRPVACRSGTPRPRRPWRTERADQPRRLRPGRHRGAQAAASRGPWETVGMQRNPEELYELGPAAPGIAGAPMLHYLEGFIDAGTAGRLLAEHVLRAFPHETVARFDADRLIDYRSRRPLMTYDNSRWESYDPPELALHLLHDQSERPFLLLTGPEPDHEWDLFTKAVLTIATRLDTGPAISFLGIPAGMPHTRPLGVIAHATREELLTGHQRLSSRIQVPGSAPALLELRFGEAGRDALGFAVQVPHYLAQAVYPPAALALLGAVTTSTGLDLPDTELREAADRTNVAIERQVADSAEVAELVRALEQQYDTATAEAAENPVTGLLAEGEAMPTADELAAQFERFLAENQDRTDPPGSAEH